MILLRHLSLNIHVIHHLRLVHLKNTIHTIHQIHMLKIHLLILHTRVFDHIHLGYINVLVTSKQIHLKLIKKIPNFNKLHILVVRILFEIFGILFRIYNWIWKIQKTTIFYFIIELLMVTSALTGGF